MTIKFVHDNSTIILFGDALAACSNCSTHLRRDIYTIEVYTLFILRVSPTEDNNEFFSVQTIVVDRIMTNFSRLFGEPNRLPLLRDTYHRIIIKPGQSPVIVNLTPHFKRKKFLV